MRVLSKLWKWVTIRLTWEYSSGPLESDWIMPSYSPSYTTCTHVDTHHSPFYAQHTHWHTPLTILCTTYKLTHTTHIHTHTHTHTHTHIAHIHHFTHTHFMHSHTHTHTCTYYAYTDIHLTHPRAMCTHHKHNVLAPSQYEYKVKGTRKVRCALQVATSGVKVSKRKSKRVCSQHVPSPLIPTSYACEQLTSVTQWVPTKYMCAFVGATNGVLCCHTCSYCGSVCRVLLDVLMCFESCECVFYRVERSTRRTSYSWCTTLSTGAWY